MALKREFLSYIILNKYLKNLYFYEFKLTFRYKKVFVFLYIKRILKQNFEIIFSYNSLIYPKVIFTYHLLNF